MHFRNWWNLHRLCTIAHAEREKPLPVLTITHAAMLMQDGGAITTSARLLGEAISKGNDTEELRLRQHLESLALSVLHLVNDREENDDETLALLKSRHDGGSATR